MGCVAQLWSKKSYMLTGQTRRNSQDPTGMWLELLSYQTSLQRDWASAGFYLETGRLSGTGHTVQPQVKQSKCQREQPCPATLRGNEQSFPNHASRAATGGLDYLLNMANI